MPARTSARGGIIRSWARVSPLGQRRPGPAPGATAAPGPWPRRVRCGILAGRPGSSPGHRSTLPRPAPHPSPGDRCDDARYRPRSTSGRRRGPGAACLARPRAREPRRLRRRLAAHLGSARRVDQPRHRRADRRRPHGRPRRLPALRRSAPSKPSTSGALGRRPSAARWCASSATPARPQGRHSASWSPWRWARSSPRGSARCRR